jgi:hypothetical protein
MHDIHLAVEILARAFEEDPLCVFMLPNKQTRVKTHKKILLSIWQAKYQQSSWIWGR